MMAKTKLHGLQRKIVNALTENNEEGMTPAELSCWLQVSMPEVEIELKKLKKLGFAMLDPMRTQRNHQKVWVIDEFGLRKIDSRYSFKMRKCLGGCDNLFQSEHAGNRICPRCSRLVIMDGTDQVAV
jgi:hypothetical protein